MQDGDLLCEKFKRQCEGGERPRLAEFLRQHPGDIDDNLLCRLVRIDIDRRRQIQEPPSPEASGQLAPLALQSAETHLVETQDAIPVARPGTLKRRSKQGGEEANGFGVGKSFAAGDSIDRYQLMETIGIGGMGAVWRATQQEPVKRIVALKLVREDAGSNKAIARFEAERQAIALMDHQNIAKIFDAGTTDCGSPFFVMELVDGQRLDTYCDESSFSIQQRLELIIPICNAVQHAHQKGIIHRDLKLSNILVCEVDGQPVPKVIDFGLAKTLDRNPLSDRTAFTELGYVVGTLQYMSPEQSQSNNHDIDTRSDLYSLGALIYKLLTGIAPIESESEEMSVYEALSWVREKDPVSPGNWFKSKSSNRQMVLAAADALEVAPEKAAAIITGDLDSIVMKALEKDRKDRYQTASELAADIRRFLNDEPVLARSPTPINRATKFVKRNRSLVASIAVTTFLLLGGIIGTSYGLFWAIEERDRANTESLRARQETVRTKHAQEGLRESERKLSRQLTSIIKQSAWSQWQLGNVSSAWRTLKQLDENEEDWLTRYLMAEMNSSDQVLYGHAREVMAVDTSTDDKLIATGGNDDSVKFWEMETRKLIGSCSTDEAVTSVDFSPDGKTLVYGDRSNRVVIIDCQTQQRLIEFPPFEHDIARVAFSPDGKTLVAALLGRDSSRAISNRDYINIKPPKIHVLSIQDQSILQTLDGHSQEIAALSMGPDGDTFASGDMSGRCCFWRTVDGKFTLEKSIKAHSLGTRGVAISPDGKQLASAGGDRTVKVWDVKTGENIRIFAGHDDVVHSVDFSPDGSQVLSASSDESAVLWNLVGNERCTFRGHYRALNAAAFSSDGKRIVTASDDQTIRIVNASTHSSLVHKAHQGTVWVIDDSPDGSLVASAGEDGFVVLTDAATGIPVDSKLAHPEAVLTLAFLHDGSLATGCADGKLRIWDLETHTVKHTVVAHGDYIWDVSVAPDGLSIVTAGEEHVAKQWNTSTWKLMQEFAGHESGMGSARFSPDGTKLLTAGDDETVRLWDVKSGNQLHIFTDHMNSVWRAVFSPDGQWIASSSFHGEILLWNTASRALVNRIKGHSAQTAGLTFSKDGSQLVSSSDDSSIKFWDVDSLLRKDNANAEIIVLTDQPNMQAVHVSFSSDGEKLFSGGIDSVTIRSAIASAQQRPFLIQEANDLLNLADIIMTQDVASEKDLAQVMTDSKKCCRFFPSYKSFTLLGQTQYLNGQLPEARVALEEAYRLQKTSYRHPDLAPKIEGYLTLVYLKIGDFAASEKMRRIFEEKYNEYGWSEDQLTKKLRTKVVELHQELTAANAQQ